MLVPPQPPIIRAEDPNNWRFVNHHLFDGKAQGSFPHTSLHLSFTQYRVPVSIANDAVDPDTTMLETLVQVYDRDKWLADLRILDSLGQIGRIPQWP